MNTQLKDIEMLIDEFQSVLQDDILNLELSLLRLDELRTAVIKRDNDVLEALVETIKIQGQDHKHLQDRRKKTLHSFAEVFNVPLDKVTISFISGHVPENQRQILIGKQNTAQNLVKKMRTEYTSTFMLLQEFTRINRMLLRGITKPKDDTVVYNAKGKRFEQSNSGSMISCRF